MVSQHLVLGLPARRLRRRPRMRQAGPDGGALRAHDVGPFPFLRRSRAAAAGRRGCCSPTTKPTCSGSSSVLTPARWSRTPFTSTSFTARKEAVNPAASGTKAAAHYVLDIAAGDRATVELRLFAEAEAPPAPFGPSFDNMFAEADRAKRTTSMRAISPRDAAEEDRRISRQAYAGLLWSKQFYHYVGQGLAGGRHEPAAAAGRAAAKAATTIGVMCSIAT